MSLIAKFEHLDLNEAETATIDAVWDAPEFVDGSRAVQLEEEVSVVDWDTVAIEPQNLALFSGSAINYLQSKQREAARRIARVERISIGALAVTRTEYVRSGGTWLDADDVLSVVGPTIERVVEQDHAYAWHRTETAAAQ